MSQPTVEQHIIDANTDVEREEADCGHRLHQPRQRAAHLPRHRQAERNIARAHNILTTIKSCCRRHRIA
jgi:hypothetical protein